MADLIVTSRVRFWTINQLALIQCVCGHWCAPEIVLPADEDGPREMECCGRKLYFRNDVRVIEAED